MASRYLTEDPDLSSSESDLLNCVHVLCNCRRSLSSSTKLLPFKPILLPLLTVTIKTEAARNLFAHFSFHRASPSSNNLPARHLDL